MLDAKLWDDIKSIYINLISYITDCRLFVPTAGVFVHYFLKVRY